MEPSIYSGTLLIKTSGVLTRRWAERYAVLRHSTLEWNVKSFGGSLTPAGEVSLQGTTLVDAPGKYPHAFELVLGDGQVLPVRADGAAAAAAWIAAFRRTAARLLVTDAPSAATEPTIHSVMQASQSLRSLSPARSPHAKVPPVLLAATHRAELLAVPADAAHPEESSTPVLLAGWLGLQHGRSLLGRARFARHFFVLRQGHLAAYGEEIRHANQARDSGAADPSPSPEAIAGVPLAGAQVDAPAHGFSAAAATFELYYPEKDEVLVVQAGSTAEVAVWLGMLRHTEAALSGAAMSAAAIIASPTDSAISVAGGHGGNDGLRPSASVAVRAQAPQAASVRPLVGSGEDDANASPDAERPGALSSAQQQQQLPRMRLPAQLPPAAPVYVLSPVTSQERPVAAPQQSQTPPPRFRGPVFYLFESPSGSAARWGPALATVTDDALVLAAAPPAAGGGSNRGSEGGATICELRLTRALVDAAAPSPGQPRNTVLLELTLDSQGGGDDAEDARTAAALLTGRAGPLSVAFPIGSDAGSSSAALSALLEAIDAATRNSLRSDADGDKPPVSTLLSASDSHPASEMQPFSDFQPAMQSAVTNAVAPVTSDSAPLPLSPGSRAVPPHLRGPVSQRPRIAALAAARSREVADAAATGPLALAAAPESARSQRLHGQFATPPLVILGADSDDDVAVTAIERSPQRVAPAGPAPSAENEAGPATPPRSSLPSPDVLAAVAVAADLPLAPLPQHSATRGRSPPRPVGTPSSGTSMEGEARPPSAERFVSSASLRARSVSAASQPRAVRAGSDAAAARTPAPAPAALVAAATSAPAAVAASPLEALIGTGPSQPTAPLSPIGAPLPRAPADSAGAPPAPSEASEVTPKFTQSFMRRLGRSFGATAPLPDAAPNTAEQADGGLAESWSASASTAQPVVPVVALVHEPATTVSASPHPIRVDLSPASPQVRISDRDAAAALTAAAFDGGRRRSPDRLSTAGLPLPPPPWAHRSSQERFCLAELAALGELVGALSPEQHETVSSHERLPGSLSRSYTLLCSPDALLPLAEMQTSDLRDVQEALSVPDVTKVSEEASRRLSQWGVAPPLDPGSVSPALAAAIRARIQRLLLASSALDYAPLAPPLQVTSTPEVMNSSADSDSADIRLDSDAESPTQRPRAVAGPGSSHSLDLLARLAREQRTRLERLQALSHELEDGSRGSTQSAAARIGAPQEASLSGDVAPFDVRSALARATATLVSITSSAKKLLQEETLFDASAAAGPTVEAQPVATTPGFQCPPVAQLAVTTPGFKSPPVVYGAPLTHDGDNDARTSSAVDARNETPVPAVVSAKASLHARDPTPPFRRPPPPPRSQGTDDAVAAATASPQPEHVMPAEPPPTPPTAEVVRVINVGTPNLPVAAAAPSADAPSPAADAPLTVAPPEAEVIAQSPAAPLDPASSVVKSPTYARLPVSRSVVHSPEFKRLMLALTEDSAIEDVSAALALLRSVPADRGRSDAAQQAPPPPPVAAEETSAPTEPVPQADDSLDGASLGPLGSIANAAHHRDAEGLEEDDANETLGDSSVGPSLGPLGEQPHAPPYEEMMPGSMNDGPADDEGPGSSFNYQSPADATRGAAGGSEEPRDGDDGRKVRVVSRSQSRQKRTPALTRDTLLLARPLTSSIAAAPVPGGNGHQRQATTTRPQQRPYQDKRKPRPPPQQGQQQQAQQQKQQQPDSAPGDRAASAVAFAPPKRTPGALAQSQSYASTSSARLKKQAAPSAGQVTVMPVTQGETSPAPQTASAEDALPELPGEIVLSESARRRRRQRPVSNSPVTTKAVKRGGRSKPPPASAGVAGASGAEPPTGAADNDASRTSQTLMQTPAERDPAYARLMEALQALAAGSVQETSRPEDGPVAEGSDATATPAPSTAESAAAHRGAQQKQLDAESQLLDAVLGVLTSAVPVSASGGNTSAAAQSAGPGAASQAKPKSRTLLRTPTPSLRDAGASPTSETTPSSLPRKAPVPRQSQQQRGGGGGGLKTRAPSATPPPAPLLEVAPLLPERRPSPAGHEGGGPVGTPGGSSKREPSPPAAAPESQSPRRTSPPHTLPFSPPAAMTSPDAPADAAVGPSASSSPLPSANAGTPTAPPPLDTAQAPAPEAPRAASPLPLAEHPPIASPVAVAAAAAAPSSLAPEPLARSLAPEPLAPSLAPEPLAPSLAPEPLAPALRTWLAAIDLDHHADAIGTHFAGVLAGQAASSSSSSSSRMAGGVSLEDMATLSADAIDGLAGVPESDRRALVVAVRALRAVLSPAWRDLDEDGGGGGASATASPAGATPQSKGRRQQGRGAAVSGGSGGGGSQGRKGLAPNDDSRADDSRPAAAAAAAPSRTLLLASPPTPATRRTSRFGQLASSPPVAFVGAKSRRQPAPAPTAATAASGGAAAAGTPGGAHGAHSRADELVAARVRASLTRTPGAAAAAAAPDGTAAPQDNPSSGARKSTGRFVQAANAARQPSGGVKPDAAAAASPAAPAAAKQWDGEDDGGGDVPLRSGAEDLLEALLAAHGPASVAASSSPVSLVLEMQQQAARARLEHRFPSAMAAAAAAAALSPPPPQKLQAALDAHAVPESVAPSPEDDDSAAALVQARQRAHDAIARVQGLFDDGRAGAHADGPSHSDRPSRGPPGHDGSAEAAAGATAGVAHQARPRDGSGGGEDEESNAEAALLRANARALLSASSGGPVIPDKEALPEVRPEAAVGDIDDELSDLLTSLGLFRHAPALAAAGIRSLVGAALLAPADLQAAGLSPADAAVLLAAQRAAAEAAVGLRPAAVTPGELAATAL